MAVTARRVSTSTLVQKLSTYRLSFAGRSILQAYEHHYRMLRFTEKHSATTTTDKLIKAHNHVFSNLEFVSIFW